ncbi:Flc expressor [Thalictrum thalictroides]|uniref:Flc expressor n=1 Tax=Thalictrum thalictroides TaxID=46969 RepID=A0A7J6V5W9_THATH|nr:Flc expressor [Thalictrum thalictroides]
MQERIISQHRQIQSLLHENQRLATTHVALAQELAASQEELRKVSSATKKLKSDRDAQVRVIYERSLKTEAELHSVEGVNAELIQVRAETNKLNASRIEMLEELKAINSELEQFRADAEKVPAIKADIVKLQYEIEMGRTAIEYEKNTHAENLEQEQEMEKNMVILACELKKLRSDLANTEKRARAAGAASAAGNPGTGYPGGYGNSERAYGGNSYVENYGMHQVQAGANGGSQY